MKKRLLGRDLEVSEIGLGCMGFTHAYGAPIDEEDGIRAIRYAIEEGCSFFDTAECYIGKMRTAVQVITKNWWVKPLHHIEKMSKLLQSLAFIIKA